MAEKEIAVRVVVLYEEEGRTVVFGTKHEDQDTLTADELVLDLIGAMLAIGFTEQTVAEAMVMAGEERLS